MTINSYKDLIVWQKAFDLSIRIFKATAKFPKPELYGLVAQMRRCGVSITSNIAEGYARGYRQEYIQFLRTAFASGAELETQLLLAKELEFISHQDFDALNALLTEIMKMLTNLLILSTTLNPNLYSLIPNFAA